MRTETSARSLSNRIVGKRYYDADFDESFTVVGITSDDNTPILVLVQYEDGMSNDMLAEPEMFPGEALAGDAGFASEETAGAYTLLGPGPTLAESRRLCQGSHKWTPLPDKIWPDGEPSQGDNNHGWRYARLVRCQRCGLSGDTAVEFLGDAPPWFCYYCDEGFDDAELNYQVHGWEEIPLCGECEEKVPDEFIQ